MTEILIATDQSSQVLGLSIFEIKEKKLLCSTSIQIKGKLPETRIATVKRIINDYIVKYTSEYKLAYIVFEGVQMQKNNVLTLQVLSELLGVCKNNAFEQNIPFMVFRPSEWRGHFHLSAGKKKRDDLKAEAISMVAKLFDKNVSDDEAEAILIGLCACEKLNAEDTGWGISGPKAAKTKRKR